MKTKTDKLNPYFAEIDWMITLPEMAQKLNVSTMTVLRMINDGDLPPLDVGKNNRHAKFWMKTTLEEFYREKRLAAQAVGSAY